MICLSTLVSVLYEHSMSCSIVTLSCEMYNNCITCVASMEIEYSKHTIIVIFLNMSIKMSILTKHLYDGCMTKNCL